MFRIASKQNAQQVAKFAICSRARRRFARKATRKWLIKLQQARVGA
jgi:hypothetical protein